MADVFDLYGKIQLDMGDYQRDLTRSVSMARAAAASIESTFQSYTKTFENVKKSASGLGDELEDTGDSTDEAKGAASKYNTELSRTATESGKAASESNKFGDALKFVSTHALDAASKVGNVLAGAAKGASVAIGAAGTALSKVVKSSLDAVSNYEQLVGGVDTLFGDASQKLQDYANQAFMTAGMSANEYMERAISFSATLIQGLEGDTDKAADIVNTAITDMADNVNKMGTTMEMVQNAYNGLSRQNYMMLDNLAIGYQGTAAEMARLINDSGVMGATFEATANNIKEISFDKYIEAIHVIQTELGISGLTAEEAAEMVANGVLTEEEAFERLGTTAKEASGTIQGSVGSMKAAWDNFLIGVGSSQQLSGVLSTAIGNIRQNLNKIIPRLTSGLTELVDLLAPEIPAIIEETLPTIIKASSTLITGISDRLPDLLTAILPSLAAGVVNVTTSLVTIMPNLISSLKQSVPIIVQTIMEKKDELKQAGKDIINELLPNDLSGIGDVAGKAAKFVSDFAINITNPENIQKVVAEGEKIVGNLIDGLTSKDTIADMVEKLPILIDNISEGIKTVLLGSDQDGEGGLFGAAKRIIVNIGEYFADEKNRQDFIDSAWNMLTSLADAGISILQNGVAPLMVELAKAWAQTFIGEIDYDDTAIEILERLGQAFVHNMTHFGLVGAFVEREQERADYVNADYRGTEDEWRNLTKQQQQEYLNIAQYGSKYGESGTKTTRTESTLAAQIGGEFVVPDAARNAYLSARGYATGFYASRPAYLTNTVVGERGDEVLLPLDTNTAWMDKLADRLNSRTGGIVIEQIVINAPTGRAEDIQAAFVAGLDEKLRDRQIMQDRGVGAMSW